MTSAPTRTRSILWSLLLPRHRTIRPTREGWWVLFIAMGLGVAAVNTGNNLLYLMVSMLLGIIVVSGVFSELSIRRLAVERVLPAEIFAGRATRFGATVVNDKRRTPSYSVTIEVSRVGGPRDFVYLLRLAPGEKHSFEWEDALPRRGRHRLPGLRVTTRFPFGLFLKAGPVILDADVIVYPAVVPVSDDALKELTLAGETSTRRRGRGNDLYNLREYRWGDDPRLIHWRSTAKTGLLTVREVEAETSTDTRIVLVPGSDPDRLESGLSQAASLAVPLLRTGVGVELVAPGLAVRLGRGRAHERRLLTALALYEPASPTILSRAGSATIAREIFVRIG